MREYTTMTRTNLKQIAYEKIKKNITECVYKPSSFLNEDTLCKELNMSRTPVRDALGRLEQEGLLEILPKKGILVTPFSMKDIDMVYECRILLEPYIIRKYCQDLSEDILKQLTMYLEKEQECSTPVCQDTYHWDNEFHQCLIWQCPNDYFKKIYDDMHSQSTRMRVMCGTVSQERIRETIEEHRKILEALKNNNADEAAENMKKHLLRSRDVIYLTFMNSAGFYDE